MSEEKKIESIELENDTLNSIAGGEEADTAINFRIYKCKKCGFIASTDEERKAHIKGTGNTHTEFEVIGKPEI